MRFIAAAVLTLWMLGFAPPALADCGFEGVRVSGADEEQAVACDALHGVRDYFAELGFALEPKVWIVFEDEVFLDIDEGDDLRVSACFNAPLHQVEITSWDSAAVDRKPWGIEWGREIVASITRHELVHMALAEALGEDYGRLGAAWHEFVAYAVQFDLMDPGLRARILQNYPELTPFTSPGHVNLYTYGVDPDAFGVRSFLFSEREGGRDFVAAVINGQVPFDTRDQRHLCR